MPLENICGEWQVNGADAGQKERLEIFVLRNKAPADCRLAGVARSISCWTSS